MQKDTELTRVIFRRFRDGELIALFPELPGDNNPSTCESYMHVGQHSAASVYIIRETTPCWPHSHDVEALIKELERVGYNLLIVFRMRPADRATRIKALQR